MHKLNQSTYIVYTFSALLSVQERNNPPPRSVRNSDPLTGARLDFFSRPFAARCLKSDMKLALQSVVAAGDGRLRPCSAEHAFDPRQARREGELACLEDVYHQLW